MDQRSVRVARAALFRALDDAALITGILVDVAGRTTTIR
jgi:hypothetical protein